MIQHFLRRLLCLALPFLALSLLAACDAQADEQQAFAEFLQTRILAKPGIRIPRLDEEDRKRLGQYAAHYEVIARYNDELAGVMGPVQSASQVATQMRTLAAMMNGVASLAEARAAMAAYRQRLASRLKQADAERRALNQPEDVNRVFDAAYRRTVTEPAALLDTQLVLIEEVLGRYHALASYLDANRSRIRVSGATAEVSDPQVRKEIQARMAAIQAMRRPVEEAQDKLRKLIQGG